MDDMDDLILEILRDNGLTMSLNSITSELKRRNVDVGEINVWQRLNYRDHLAGHGVYQTVAWSGVVYGISE